MLRYTVHGNPNGALAIFISGWPDHCAKNFDKQIKVMAPNYRCVCVSIPGYEEVQTEEDHKLFGWFGYNMHTIVEMYAATVTRVIDEAPNKTVKPVQIAHDWGCTVASNYNRRHGTDVFSKIILLDIGPEIPKLGGGFMPAIFILWYQWTLATMFLVCEILLFFLPAGIRNIPHVMFGKLLAAPNASDSTCRMSYMYFRLWANIFTMSLPVEMTAKRASEDPFPEYNNLPVLFMWASNKPMQFFTPRWTEFVNNKKDGKSEATSFTGGHWFFRKDSKVEQVNEKILTFLKN